MTSAVVSARIGRGPGFRGRLALTLLFMVSGVRIGAQDASDSPAEAWLADQPKEAFDVDALAAKFTTPQEAFAYVRDQIAYEPYAGVMKGAAGALLTHGANDFDRSLLLARLLATQGIDVKIVRGRMPAAAAAGLADAAVRAPDAIDRMVASLPSGAAPAPATPAQKDFDRLFRQRVSDRAAEIRLDSTAQQPILEPLLAAVAAPPGAPPAAHVWVEAAIDGKTVDFDASLEGAKPGLAPADVEDAWDPDSLPDDVYHLVTVRVVEQTLAGDQLARKELLAHDFRSVDLVTAGFRVAILPKVGKEVAGDLRPVLLSGDDQSEGDAFRLSGEAARPAEPAGAGGLLGGFGGGAPEPAPTPDAAGASRLARLWIETTLRAPALPDETDRRMILDRAEPAGAGWRLDPALADDRRVAALLLQTWDGAVDVGAPHPLALLRAQLAAVKTLDPLLAAVRQAQQPAAGDLPAPGLCPQLWGFFLASGLARHQLGAAAGPGVRGYLVRPRLAFLRHGFAPASWVDPAGAPPRFVQGIDLVNAPFGFSGPRPAAALLALRCGIADTVLEQFALHRSNTSNTVPLFRAARDQKVALIVVRRVQDLDQVNVPPAIRAVLQGDVTDGRVLVAPAHPVALAGAPAYGWWSLDPATGYAVGRMDLGGAQALSEAEEVNQKVTEWTEAYVKFLGNALNCYRDAVRDALGSVKPDIKNMSVSVTVNHGDNPLPDTDQLIDCLKDAACDALKDFLEAEMNSSAFAEETENLKEDILRLEEEQLRGKAGDAAAGVCGKLLKGGE